MSVGGWCVGGAGKYLNIKYKTNTSRVDNFRTLRGWYGHELYTYYKSDINMRIIKEVTWGAGRIRYLKWILWENILQERMY